MDGLTARSDLSASRPSNLLAPAQTGQADSGRMHLETALDVLHRAAPLGAEATAAEYHYKLGR